MLELTCMPLCWCFKLGTLCFWIEQAEGMWEGPEPQRENWSQSLKGGHFKLITATVECAYVVFLVNDSGPCVIFSMNMSKLP